MSIESKNKIELLKRKSRRNNLIKELENYIRVSNDSFLDIEDNNAFCKKVFEKISTIRNKVNIAGKDYKECIELSKDYLERQLKRFNLDVKYGRVFFYREREIEAVRVNIDEILPNFDRILDISRFLCGYADFVLVDDGMCFGICIERTEYYYEFSTWGIEQYLNMPIYTPKGIKF